MPRNLLSPVSWMSTYNVCVRIKTILLVCCLQLSYIGCCAVMVLDANCFACLSNTSLLPQNLRCLYLISFMALSARQLYIFSTISANVNDMYFIFTGFTMWMTMTNLERQFPIFEVENLASLVKYTAWLLQNEETQVKMGRYIWRHGNSTLFLVCRDRTTWLPRMLIGILPRLFLYCPKPVFNQKIRIHVNRIILYGLKCRARRWENVIYLDHLGADRLIFMSDLHLPRNIISVQVLIRQTNRKYVLELWSKPAKIGISLFFYGSVL